MNIPRRGPCGCRKGLERDNCANCEGTGIAIDWSAYWAAKRAAEGKFINPANVTVTGPFHVTGHQGGQVNLSKSDIDILIARVNAFEAWRNGRRSYATSEVPEGLAVSNEDRSRLEAAQFQNNKDDRYFVYVSLSDMTVTTWIGEQLGVITWLGQAYKSNLGDIRQQVNIHAINGERYYGVYYRSSGDYARIYRMKGE